jgi:hypothetical protein
MIQGKAVAYANNDVVQIGWSFDQKISGCLGFAVSRIPADADGPEEVLTSHVGFDEAGSEQWIARLTTVQPIAGFRWRDLYPLRDTAVRYKVVAMGGPAAKPVPLQNVAPMVTPPVNATEDFGNVKVFFNRGLLSTQHLARGLKKKGPPTAPALLKEIVKAGNSFRLELTGELLGALLLLLERAKQGGACFAALYELTDGELIKALAAVPNLHLVLSNNGTGEKGAPYDEGNIDAAKALAGADLIRRYMPKGQIGHNKFVVYVDPDGNPEAVLTGSTNWTATGLCTQSNNAILIQSRELAKLYLDYWNDLKADAQRAGIPAAPEPMRKIQDATLRGADATPRRTVQIAQGPSAKVWFSPNMPGRLGDYKQPSLPPDLAELFDMCAKAKQAVMFLCFQPGSAGSNIATLVKYLSQVSQANPGLLIRGVISDQAESEEFMHHRDDDEDADVIAPAGILAGFAEWEKEFYRAGHAIVHDKIVVIDPFSDDCAVVTGSHNLGYRASHNNDENMLILRGDKRIAQAYATHVFDVYSHYRWRFYMMEKAQRLADQAWRAAGAKPEEKKQFPASRYFEQVVGWKHNEANDSWQDRYFDKSSMAYLERQFWVSEGEPLSPRIPKQAGGANRGAVPLPPIGSGPAQPKRAPARGAAARAPAAPKRTGRNAGGKTAGRKSATRKSAAAAPGRSSDAKASRGKRPAGKGGAVGKGPATGRTAVKKKVTAVKKKVAKKTRRKASSGRSGRR